MTTNFEKVYNGLIPTQTIYTHITKYLLHYIKTKHLSCFTIKGQCKGIKKWTFYKLCFILYDNK